MIIPDDQVQEALDFIEGNAVAAAQATANRKHLEDFTKSLKALLMQERVLDPLGAQERYALAHPKMLEHLEAKKQAVFEDERQQNMLNAKHTKLDVWRSLSARERAGLI
jgi:hypothetical protein